MSAAPTLDEIAEHIQAGREFHHGQWVETTPVDGLSEPRWRRKAFVTGVEISRQVIAEQLRAVAAWHWNPDA